MMETGAVGFENVNDKLVCIQHAQLLDTSKQHSALNILDKILRPQESV